jgi:putative transposase
VRFTFIAAEKALPDAYPLRVYCRVLGVTRAGYYAWLKRPDSGRKSKDQLLQVKCVEIFNTEGRCYGSPRIRRALQNQGFSISRKRVARLMQTAGIRGISRRRTWRKSPPCTKGLAPFRNLLRRKFKAQRPDQKWVCDTTEMRAGGARLFVAVIMDLFSRRIIGWSLGLRNDEALVTAALQQALATRQGERTLVHSDQGSTYASLGVQQCLRDAQKRGSMSRRANCWDNAVMESWFGTLKAELGDTFPDVRTADDLLFGYIETFYNTRRMHSYLNYQSPAEFELAFHQRHQLKQQQAPRVSRTPVH